MGNQVAAQDDANCAEEDDMTNLEAVHDAYEGARKEQLRYDPAPLKRLPPWEILSSEMQQAMIHVFFEGMKTRP